jgi:hypothetical protein
MRDIWHKELLSVFLLAPEPHMGNFLGCVLASARF